MLPPAGGEPAPTAWRIRNGWAGSIAVALVVAIGVVLVAGAAAYVGAQHAVDRYTHEQKVERTEQEARDAAGRAQVEEYRRQQCVISGALPTPRPVEVEQLRTSVLRCQELPVLPPNR